MNDPFEGLFSITKWEGGGLVRSLAMPLARPIIRDLSGNYPVKRFDSLEKHESLKNARVCSLSRELHDVRVWSYYADSCRGCAIEFELPEGPPIFPMNYGDGLRHFEKGLTQDSTASEILSYKTAHWQHEVEYRIIGVDEFFPAIGQVTSIYLGPRVNTLHEQLIRSIAGNIPIVNMQLDTTSVRVIPKS